MKYLLVPVEELQGWQRQEEPRQRVGQTTPLVLANAMDVVEGALDLVLVRMCRHELASVLLDAVLEETVMHA